MLRLADPSVVKVIGHSNDGVDAVSLDATVHAAVTNVCKTRRQDR